MKRRIAALVLLLCGAAVLAQAKSDWIIVPGQRVGPVDANASEAKLVALFGARNVTRESFEVEPGVAFAATVLFASEPTRRAVVLWRDDEARTSPESVVIRGERSEWRTDRGITLGTPLSVLRRINGKPLTLIGFGSDVGGTVLDNGGGALTELGAPENGERTGRTLALRVEPDPSQRDSPAYQQSLGDVELSSESDAMRALNPRVFSLMVDIAAK
ncbi:MAG: hypothetical protein JO090_12765 [Rhizobacter sp.]|nr:hypothetical protein [Rhizobacter sp.]